mgnify:CR=1 FL=1
MNTATLNGHTATRSSWQTLTVRNFFEQIPWTGVVPVAPSASANPDEDLGIAATQLSMTQKVSDFFELFPWDGKPNIAAPVAPMEVQPELPSEDSMTLDGFADMF